MGLMNRSGLPGRDVSSVGGQAGDGFGRISSAVREGRAVRIARRSRRCAEWQRIEQPGRHALLADSTRVPHARATSRGNAKGHPTLCPL